MIPIHKIRSESGRTIRKFSIRDSRCWLLGIACASVVACSEIHQPPANIPPSEEMLARVTASPRGITMAVGDVAQLSVEARNILGDLIPVPGDTTGSNRIIYRVLPADTSRLRVSAAGVLRATRITSGTNPMRMFVSWQYRGITKADTVYVKITQTRPAKPVTTLTIQPAPTDSARLGFSEKRIIPVRAYDEDDRLVSGVYAYLDTDRRRNRITPDDLNPTTGELTVQRMGSFWIYAQSLVYGTLLRDSIEWVGTHRSTAGIGYDGLVASYVLDYPAIYVAPCGIITFVNNTNQHYAIGGPRSVLIELDNPELTGACKTGDVTGDVGELLPGQRVTRVIPHPGTVRVWISEVGPPRQLRATYMLIVR